MGILDDAIREHLDLKRRHGAREAELREIEDEAFGAGEQADPFAAAGVYTEVASAEAPDIGNEEPTRLVEPDALRHTELEPEAAISDEPQFEPEALRPTEPPTEPETSDQSGALEPPSPIPGQ